MATLKFREIPSANCSGGRTCEVVCSFHHTKSFDPTSSSIQVERDFNTGDIHITLAPSL